MKYIYDAYLTYDFYSGSMLIMKVKIEKQERATRIVSVRFTPTEYAAIEAKSNGVKPATLIRAIVTQMIRAGIEVN